ncbi:hypothetical protein JDV48_12890 [Escherichia coli]|nr:hypothetical protein [Escherichia coli]
MSTITLLCIALAGVIMLLLLVQGKGTTIRCSAPRQPVSRTCGGYTGGRSG